MRQEERTALDKSLAHTPWRVAQFTGVFETFLQVDPLGAGNYQSYLKRTEDFLRLHRQHILPANYPLPGQTLVIRELANRCFTPAEVALGSVSEEQINMLAVMLMRVSGIVKEPVLSSTH